MHRQLSLVLVLLAHTSKSSMYVAEYNLASIHCFATPLSLYWSNHICYGIHNLAVELSHCCIVARTLQGISDNHVGLCLNLGHGRLLLRGGRCEWAVGCVGG